MYLLNSLLINSYVESESTTLFIKEYLSKNLQHTFYYFRLGSEGTHKGKPFELSNRRESKHLTLEPGDFAVIKTHEAFFLSEQILGIFGQSSDLAKEGLQVLHSPFIDPGFKGQLKFGIKNLNNIAVSLEFAVSLIGKVCFFDISDTYPINIKKNSIIYKKFLESQE
jgi:deoxycytidine triphosphate deaminase